MKFDTIIIGGGMAGLSCALRCLEAGLKTAVIASGQSALHFSSGSVDVLAKTPDGKHVVDPMRTIEYFKDNYPTHPYSVLGKETVSRALAWYQTKLSDIGVPLRAQQDGHNHYRLTPLGTMKSTWLSQPFVHQFPMTLENSSVKKMVLITIDGFRDFQPKLAQDNLKLVPQLSNLEITTASVSLSAFKDIKRNHCELRSIDLSRILSKRANLQEFAHALQQHANPGDLVVIPAIFGNGTGLALLKEIEALTQLTLCEVPTMPPSLLGIRLEESMKHAFINQGGTLFNGDHVIQGEFSYVEKEDPTNSYYHLNRLFTKNHGDFPLQAKHFVLATGSFFSQGLKASVDSMQEPIFGLDIDQTDSRTDWYNPEFFSPLSHPFLSMGVKTNDQFQALKSEHVINNLFCAGAILSGYNPILEGCGSGVAISTGFYAAETIIKQQSVKTQPIQHAEVAL
ncbi:glycerol-3-phosphate dehydrogenase subunit GlpB [Aliivibrio salmonicida]|uniref:Anaerobic glycerol-3-phosphate dehydrogenase subunit B n=1 Tax=Aliivibrio salmonicida (strain LFI1238) TaxID=316275 RepID=B6ER20_ALISL|nr:glycerol-3-phosphate dehydrogenase subunit GlpB [Aliivibrio salmonicida]AZL86548.1 glycerol-3-phosphate dehydrogenase subunit GlpB [Aliivibrio salmonicida]CAQ81150.1 anaerobic glycerol-3-phosphate dehydrogenase subunit B [Aliivibrio salmonicida LFI1238]